MAIIPERNHATSNCGCNELSLGNNLEGRVFTVICLPREFVKPATIAEPYGDSLDTLNNASLRYTNSSMVYIGELSEINTTIPHLARRAPLGKLEREPVVDYRPYGGEIDYAEHPEILRGVLLRQGGQRWKPIGCRCQFRTSTTVTTLRTGPVSTLRDVLLTLIYIIIIDITVNFII